MGNIDSDEEDEQYQSGVARRRNMSASGMHIPSAARAERLAARKVTSRLVHSTGKQKGNRDKHDFADDQVFRRKSVVIKEARAEGGEASSSAGGRNRRESIMTKNFGGIDKTTVSLACLRVKCSMVYPDWRKRRENRTEHFRAPAAGDATLRNREQRHAGNRLREAQQVSLSTNSFLLPAKHKGRGHNCGRNPLP